MDGDPAAIYARISRDAEGLALGVERQKEDCQALASRLGLNVVAVHVENDLSASSNSRKPRPRYEEMLRAVESGLVRWIISYSTSRLTRRPMEFERLIQLAEQRGLRIGTISAGEVDLDTADGRMIARFLAAADAREAEANSERARRAKQQRRERGLWPGGPRPFGFEPDGVTPRLVEVRLIRDAVEDILQGRSLSGIARHWQDQTGGTPQGASWRNTSVRDVLMAPRMAGHLNDGVTKAPWSPVVPAARWALVRAVLDDVSRRPGRGPQRLLSGIATCTVCGGAVHGSKARHGARTYKCGRGCCTIQSDPVDDLVGGVVVEWLARQQLRPPTPAVDVAGREEAALRARLGEAAAMFAAGEITRDQLTVITARLRTELDALQVEAVSAARGGLLASLPIGADELGDHWWGCDVDQRRALLQATGLRVALRPPGRGVKVFDGRWVQVSGPGGSRPGR